VKVFAMPQGRRKLPFSGKQKKQQIQEKRKRKQLNAASGMTFSEIITIFGIFVNIFLY